MAKENAPFLSIGRKNKPAIPLFRTEGFYFGYWLLALVPVIVRVDVIVIVPIIVPAKLQFLHEIQKIWYYFIML